LQHYGVQCPKAGADLTRSLSPDIKTLSSAPPLCPVAVLHRCVLRWRTITFRALCGTCSLSVWFTCIPWRREQG